jgi:mono/diheme cytochrome c family protein
VRRVAAERAGPERAARLPRGLAQAWIPALSRVDRCAACHAAIEGGPELLGAKNPARSHPSPALLAAHPVETFGCTLCHGGQGAATTRDAAHGDVPFWPEPMLSSKRAARYGLTAAELLETNCAACHRGDAPVEGMPLVNEAKGLLKAKRCAACHRVDGAGGVEGPDLTKEGDKPPEHFVFPAGWDGPRTAFEWHVRHFLDPAAVTPGSAMPNLKLTERQAKALALLVMSWKSRSLPPAWTPRPSR